MSGQQFYSECETNKFFPFFTGYQESVLQKLPEASIRDIFVLGKSVCFPGVSSNTSYQIDVHNPGLPYTYSAGSFHVLPLSDLLASSRAASSYYASQCSVPVSQPPLLLDVRDGPEALPAVDVTALQADPKNAECLFQVASNFNAVEASSESFSPDSPGFTELYTSDKTQGPAASLGAAPAAIARVHAAFASPEKPPSEWRQTSSKQVELLGDLKEYFSVVNGYVMPNTEETKEFPKDKNELRAIEEKVRVGIHCNVDAAVSYYSDAILRLVPPGQKIHQLFCAAVNMGQGTSGRANASLPDAEERAKTILRAAYRATYFAAATLNCKKLFLTLIGGGAFCNKTEWIIDAIVDAHREFCNAQLHVALEEVHLSIFSGMAEEIRAKLGQVQDIPWKVICYKTKTDSCVLANSKQEPSCARRGLAFIPEYY